MTTRGEKKDVEKEVIKNLNSIEEENKEKNTLLVLSYFDRVRGPSLLYCEENFNHFELRNVLDVLESGTFIFAFRNYQTINHIFYVESNLARGGIETVMITFMIKNTEVEDVFRYLESKTPLLEEFSQDLMELEELPRVLHNQSKIDDLFTIGSPKFRNNFLQIYSNYYEKLCPVFKKESWRKIEVVCPICKTLKELDIPERIINQESFLTSVLIPEFRVCNHAFMQFINKNFEVRGYQKVDFKIRGLELKNKVKPQDIDVFSVKMNLKPEILIHALNAFLLKKKILILINHDIELKKSIDFFFRYLFQGSFKIDLSIETRKNYKRNKDFYESHVILGKKTLSVNKQYLNNKFKREKDVINCFYNEVDSLSSIINLRDKIREFYILSNKICESFEEKGRPQYFSRKNVIKDLENTYYIKIKKDYFFFLNNIVKNYFNVKIMWFQDYVADKIEEMWGNSTRVKIMKK